MIVFLILINVLLVFLKLLLCNNVIHYLCYEHKTIDYLLFIIENIEAYTYILLGRACWNPDNIYP